MVRGSIRRRVCLLVCVLGACTGEGGQATPESSSTTSIAARESIDLDVVTGGWTDAEGTTVPDGSTKVGDEWPLTIDAFRGPEHCEWQTAVIMWLAVPVGSVQDSFSRDAINNVVEYTRDPDGVMEGIEPRSTLDLDADLPSSARFTGLDAGEIELWVDPEHVDQYVFVTNGETTERWPRSERRTLCA